MQFTPAFYLAFYAQLRETFESEWPGGKVPRGDLQVWTLTKEMQNPKNASINPEYVVKERLGVGERYFYQRLKIAENGKQLVNAKDVIAKACFRYVGCQGRSLTALFEHFCTKFEVPEDTVEAQRKCIEKSAKKLNSVDTQHIAKPQPGPMKGVGGKCRHYLPNSNWWLYFYGYEVPENNTYLDGPWKLLRLVLTFTDEGSANLDVSIRNKRDPNHYDYIGSTDFDNSSDTVLTMHLHTEPGRARQLNIYVNIGSGAGDLFMGQYLNYDEQGYIFSGTLIMERIDQVKYPDPQPHAFAISREAVRPNEYPAEIAHIAPLLQDRKLNFRRTPIIVHRASDIAIWQARRTK